MGAKLGATALASSLAACGGGASDPVNSPAFVSRLATTTTAPLSVADAARFLAQATPGFNRADLNALQASGFSAWLLKQFATPTTQSHCDWLTAKGYNAVANINSTTGVDNTIWRKLISSNDPLRQRVVLALSEICVVSVLGIPAQWRQYSVAHYLDILEANAFGNYRTLLQQITLSPAMSYYLTYQGSVKANPTTGSEPDENYARELMQLFTIGLYQLNSDGTVKTTNGNPIPTYSQADVSGLARVFTGWKIDTTGLTAPYPPDIQIRNLIQQPSIYETGSKSFLGVTIPAGQTALQSLNTALDTVFNHPNLPVFVGKQMIQRLVTSNPSTGYVQRVAAAFTNNGSGVRGDMKALITAVLMDNDARNPAIASGNTYGKLREPVIRFLNLARAYSANSPSDAWAIGDLSDPSRLGQSPMRSPTVFNFFRPGYVPPNTTLATLKLTGPEFQITNETTVSGYVNYMQNAIAGSGVGDLAADYSSLLALAGDPAGLLKEINEVLACSQIPTTVLTQIQTAITGIAITTPTGKLNRVKAALTLVMATPEYIIQQ
jgi:uncharacterized protein (DUF1800 family)